MSNPTITASAPLSPALENTTVSNVALNLNSPEASQKDLEKGQANISGKREQKWKVRLKNYMVNKGKAKIFVLIYVLCQIAVFLDRFIEYNYNPRYYSIRAILKNGLPIARGSAGVIQFNLALILFPVCRNIISRLRTTFLNSFIPFDKNIAWHKIIVSCTVFFTFTHIGAHTFNLLAVSKATSGPSPEFIAMFWGTGLSGQIAAIALFLIVTSSLEKMRRTNFEVFWYTHHLFVVFFVALMIHGQFCFIKADTPPYCIVGGYFWRFFVLNGTFYSIERILREYRGRKDTHISKVVLHPSKVVEVQIKKPSAVMKAGQYIFLNCPDVSPFQWHPFTLTSAPEEDYLSVHIRVVGDWTEAFGRRMGITFTHTDANKEAVFGNQAKTALPMVMLDGPYGSASEDCFKYEVSILVGAGIGITPFASVLNSIWYREKNPTTVMKLRKVYFYWVCRDKEAFEWFQDLLVALETEELSSFLEINTYLTAPLKPDEIKNVVYNTAQGQRDAVTGLKSPTFYGRPNFDDIFSSIKRMHPGTDIGVFFCGPKALSTTLQETCNKWTSSEEWGARFYYHKENF